MKTPKPTKEDNLKILYRQKLKEKGEALIEHYTKHPQLTTDDIAELTDVLNGNNYKCGYTTEAYEDFFAIKRAYNRQRSEDMYVLNAYIYNYYILSCFLYLNNNEKIPWDIIFYWEEVDVTHPRYKGYSLDKLVEETPLDYIEIKLDKVKCYNH